MRRKEAGSAVRAASPAGSTGRSSPAALELLASDAESELMELQRRITTLTAALSEKAEENLDLHREVAELKQRPKAQDAADKRAHELEAEVARLSQERQAQEELNVEFQRRITTLSVCLGELAELNATTLSEQLGPERARALFQRNDAVQGVARQASLGLVHIPEGSSLDQVLAATTPLPHSSSSSLLHLTDEPQAPMTPQILQDYQGEIERLKFRLKKRKAKMAQLREELKQAQDREAAALKSSAKYEKHIKKLEREGEENLVKEAERRKQAEGQCKNLKRRIGELEFLLEDEAQNDGGGDVELAPDTDASDAVASAAAAEPGAGRVVAEGPRMLCLASNAASVWAGCSDGRMRCFSIAQGVESSAATSDDRSGGSVHSVCCVGDDAVLGGCEDGTLRLWPGDNAFTSPLPSDTAARPVVALLWLGGTAVLQARASHTRTLVVRALDGSELAAVDLPNRARCACAVTAPPHAAWVAAGTKLYGVSWDADARRLTATVVMERPHGERPTCALACAGDGRVWSMTERADICVWAPAGLSGRVAVPAGVHARCLCAVAMTMWIGCSDGQVRVYDARSLELRRSLAIPHKGEVVCMVRVGSGAVWAATRSVPDDGERGALCVWDAVTGDEQ